MSERENYNQQDDSRFEPSNDNDASGYDESINQRDNGIIEM
jgi:hypothetical protein